MTRFHKCMSRYAAIATALMMSAALGSCSLMHDDLDPCPTGIDVSICFDYNIERTNLFGPEINGVTVYVFDTNGKLVTQKEESGKDLWSNDYRMHINVDPGSYTLVAIGAEDSYEAILAGNGAKFRRPALNIGDDISMLNVQLDSKDGVVSQNGAPLHNYYQSIAPVNVTYNDMEYAHAEIGMMRLCNIIHLKYHRSDFPSDIDPDDFEIYIVGRNGHINFDNSLLGNEEIKYIPFSKVKKVDETDNIARVHADLNFARVMSDAGNDARLVVHDKLTGSTNVIENLPAILAEGRKAEAHIPYNYSAQEYLDRQNEYELQFTIDDKLIKWVEVRISVLNWSKRIQLINF